MTPQKIHIFKAGTHTAMNGARLAFSEGDLSRTAAAYSPRAHVAPLVLGHPAQDAPAYGSVLSLQASGGNLVAEANVGEELTKMVRDGKYLRVSSSFYSPDAPGNPMPGVFYLRHVGFLGATPPAVKGLEPPSFGEQPSGCVCFVEGVRLPTPTHTPAPSLDYAENPEAFHAAAQLMVRQTGMSYAKAAAAIDSRAQQAKALEGVSTSPERLRLHQAVVSFQEQHPGMGYETALNQVLRR